MPGPQKQFVCFSAQPEKSWPKHSYGAPCEVYCHLSLPIDGKMEKTLIIAG